MSGHLRESDGRRGEPRNAGADRAKAQSRGASSRVGFDGLRRIEEMAEGGDLAVGTELTGWISSSGTRFPVALTVRSYSITAATGLPPRGMMGVEGVHLEVFPDVLEEPGCRVPTTAGPHVRDVVILRSVPGRVMLPPNVLRQPLQDRGDVPATECLVDLLHGRDVLIGSPFAISAGTPAAYPRPPAARRRHQRLGARRAPGHEAARGSRQAARRTGSADARVSP